MRQPHMRRAATAALLAAAALSALVGTATGSSPIRPQAASATAFATPIQHVVIIYQENHSFDNVLGWLCVNYAKYPPRQPCNGSTSPVTLSNGVTVPIIPAQDVVAPASHSSAAQAAAVDGGKMDGWNNISPCLYKGQYRCVSEYQPSSTGANSVANLWNMAANYVVADETFAAAAVPSWGAHLELAAATLDGFTGENPKPMAGHTSSYGWGCSSGKYAQWAPYPGAPLTLQRSCIPTANGTTGFGATPVAYAPTIVEEASAAGLTWGSYGQAQDWNFCSYFSAIALTALKKNCVLPSSQLLSQATAGTLPNLVFVLPNGTTGSTSQHNGDSMALGDNWLAKVVGDIMSGPDWATTAIFIQYDDCGCFYDHVPPPPGLGIRTPTVIISPYAKPGYTDSNTASTVSMLAFVEWVFGLAPLNSTDAAAYDYSNSFNFTAPARVAHPTFITHVLSPAELRYLSQNPPAADDT